MKQLAVSLPFALSLAATLISACTTEQDLGNRPMQAVLGMDASSESDPLDASAADSSRPDAMAQNDGRSDAGRIDAAISTGPDASIDSGLPVVSNAKRVFATSGTYTGDLKTEGAGVDGVDGADRICATAAAAAALGGTWKAWLSSSTVNAYSRMNDVSPWYLVDRRTKVFENKTGLLQGALKIGPFVDIKTNEFGVVNPPADTWTGTEIGGVAGPRASPFACKDWTNNQSVNGYEGLVGIGIGFNLSWWTDSATNPCKNRSRLYCFEQ
jgi:hypothetical protein